MHTQPQSRPVTLEAKLVVMESGGILVYPLGSGPQWNLGRVDGGAAPRYTIGLHSPIASRLHGCLRLDNGVWYYIDNPENTNGTIYNGRRIPKGTGGPVRLFDGDLLRIDRESQQHSDQNAVLMLFTTASMEGSWTQLSLKGRQTIRIGRYPDNDVVEKLPYLSGRHAEITSRGGVYYLSDCGSKAGTYLNRQRVTRPVPLRDKDCFRLADRSYFLLGDTLAYMVVDPVCRSAVLPENRPVVLRADIRTKQVKDNRGSGMKELLRDIHLEIRQGTLVAMLGTAGAGKTTVMNCLNGMDLQGVSGSVIYRNVDLLQNFEQMKSLIGSVPQQKIFHKTFTPEQEFRFAARKRLPGDTTDQEIRTRVDKTLEVLSIQGVRHSRNCKLSGGEQTRVNVGIELVADRDFLCLDEPDQGLSPNYKHELFEILRNLAHNSGKTMLAIIHDVSEIDMFDQVIMLAKKDGVGRLAFSGTPRQAKQFFGVDIRDAYSLLDKHPERYIR